MNACILLIICVVFVGNVGDAFILRPTIHTKKVAGRNSVSSSSFSHKRKPALAVVPKKRRSTVFFGSPSDQNNGRPLSIIIAGAPASGKGTQCELIKEAYGVVHLSTGDTLRAAVAAGSPVGLIAKEYMDSGRLVPDEVIIGVVKERLQQEDCKELGWLLDGFPRTQAQAEALMMAGVCADCFLFLNVPDEILVERVVGRRTDPVTGKIYHVKYFPPPDDDPELTARLVHRSDDTEEKVVVRLKQFHANVKAVKGYYTDISVEIDGTSKPSEVASAIGRALEEKCGRKTAVLKA